MKRSMMILVLFSLLIPQAFACSEDGSSGFAPEGFEPVPVGDKNANITSEEQFNAIIDSVITIYDPIIASMGAKLEVKRLWTNNTANASAQRSGKNWIINMYGGLARHATITPDGFALVVCHEIGHHIGGSPKYTGFFNMNKWASNEGQSDYFASLKCLRRVFMNDNNEEIVRAMTVPAKLHDSCTTTYRDMQERALCERIGMAGYSTAAFLAGSKPTPQFETPSTEVVRKTAHGHPAAQCRLDTYLQGVLCDKNFNEDVSQSDEVQGTCHPKLGDTLGSRPLCWFKQKA